MGPGVEHEENLFLYPQSSTYRVGVNFLVMMNLMAVSLLPSGPSTSSSMGRSSLMCLSKVPMAASNSRLCVDEPGRSSSTIRRCDFTIYKIISRCSQGFISISFPVSPSDARMSAISSPVFPRWRRKRGERMISSPTP